MRRGVHGPRRLAQRDPVVHPRRRAAATGSTRWRPGGWASSTGSAAPTTRRSRSTPGPSSPARTRPRRGCCTRGSPPPLPPRRCPRERRGRRRRRSSSAGASGDARSLAAAHTAIGMSAELDHDFNGAALAFDRALGFAEQAGDALQEVRIRNAPRRARDRPGRRHDRVHDARPGRAPRRGRRVRLLPRPRARQPRPRAPGPRPVRGGARRLLGRARDLRPRRLAVGRLPARPRGQPPPAAG